MALPSKMSQAELQKYLDAGKLSLGKKYNAGELIQDLADRGVEIEGLNAPKIQPNIPFNDDPFAPGAGYTPPVTTMSDVGNFARSAADASANALPAIGGMIGGSVGTIGTAPTGPGMVGGAMAGAGVGAATGEIGKQAIQRMIGTAPEMTVGDELKNIAIQGAVGSISEGAGRVIIGGAKMAISPFLSSYSDEIASLAAKKGVKLPVSAMSESNAVRIGETVASKGITGAGVENVVDAANQKILSIADDVVKGLGGSDDALTAGKSILQGAEETKTVWQNLKSTLYGQADELMKSRPKAEYINLENTKSTIDAILGKKADAIKLLGSEVNVSRLAKLRANLNNPKNISIGSVNSALDELGQMIKQGGLVKVGDEGALAKVAATMAGDLDNHIALVDDALGKALSSADEAYKNGIQLLESNAGEKIASLMDSPEKIVESIVKPNSQSDVTRLIKLVGSGEKGAERVANVRATFARKLISDSTDAKYGNLMGAKLATTLKRYGGTVSALFDEDTVQALNEVSKLAIAMDKAQMVSRGSQTAFSSKLIALTSSIMSGNVPAAVGIAGSDAALSKIFTTNVGRKWLTEGLAKGIPDVVSGAGSAVTRGITQGAGQLVTN